MRLSLASGSGGVLPEGHDDVIPMGNYVIEVGNYVIATPQSWGII